MGRKVDAKTELQDDWGESQTYYAMLHGAGEGFRLLVKLTRLAGGALGRAWGAFSPTEVGEKIGEVASVLDQGLDGNALAGAVERLATQILEEGGDTFVREILKHTNRNGEPLEKLHVFDQAYRANYGELFSAIVWVLKENYGPFFSQRLGKSISGLASRVAETAERFSTLSKPAETQD